MCNEIEKTKRPHKRKARQLIAFLEMERRMLAHKIECMESRLDSLISLRDSLISREAHNTVEGI
jgi:hypothetical protein